MSDYKKVLGAFDMCHLCKAIRFFFGSFFLFGLIAGMGVKVATGQVDDLEENFRISSIVGALLSNAEGMEIGDVLLVEDRFYDGLNPKFNAAGAGGTKHEFIISRIAFDFLNEKKVLTISRSLVQYQDFSNISDENQGRTFEVSEWLRLYDIESQTFQERLNNRIRKVELTTADPNGLNHADVMTIPGPDPRTLGMGSATSLYGFSERRSGFLTFLTGEQLFDHKKSSESVEVRFELGRVPPDHRSVAHFKIDPATNMPHVFKKYVESLDGFTRSKYPDESTFEWEELNKLFVPRTVRGKCFTSYQDLNSKPINGWSNYEIRLHWFSLNERIDDSFFDERILKDSDRVQQLIDPRVAEAPRLLELLERYEAQVK